MLLNGEIGVMLNNELYFVIVETQTLWTCGAEQPRAIFS